MMMNYHVTVSNYETVFTSSQWWRRWRPVVQGYKGTQPTAHGGPKTKSQYIEMKIRRTTLVLWRILLLCPIKGQNIGRWVMHEFRLNGCNTQVTIIENYERKNLSLLHFLFLVVLLISRFYLWRIFFGSLVG